MGRRKVCADGPEDVAEEQRAAQVSAERGRGREETYTTIVPPARMALLGHGGEQDGEVL